MAPSRPMTARVVLSGDTSQAHPAKDKLRASLVGRSLVVVQIWTAPSLPALASLWPSLEKATDQTSSTCPSSVACSVHVVVFHSLIVVSALAEASVSPSGENASEVI